MRFFCALGAAASLFLFSCVDGDSGLMATTPSIEQGLTSTFTATADAWVDSGNINSNAGVSMLEVRGGSGQRQMTLLRFDTAAIQAAIGTRTVTSASLQLNIASANAAPLAAQFLVNALSTSSWTEMGATFKCGTDINTADNITKCATGTSWNFDSSPPYGPTSASTNIPQLTTGWASFNVLPILTAGITNGWVVRRPSTIVATTGATFYPREAPNAPRLVLTFATVCGDGVKEGSESCDDGNTTGGDGCASICKLESWSDDVLVSGDIDAGLGRVTALARDGGRLYVALGAPRNSIVEMLANGETRLVAGSGRSLHNDSAHVASKGLRDPSALAARNGTLYVAEGFRISAIAPDGTRSTIAGDEINGFSGDGGPATAARISRVTSIVASADGSITFADSSNRRIRRISSTGIVTTIGGNGNASSSGDGGPATNAGIVAEHVVLQADGSVVVGGDGRLRRFVPGGTISTIAGTGVQSNSGDGGAATTAQIVGPSGLAIAVDGAILMSSGSRIRRLASGVITTVGGVSTSGNNGDGGPATAALLAPGQLIVGSDGITFGNDDVAASTLRRIDISGIVSTRSARVGSTFAGDGGAAVSAILAYPDSAVEMPDGAIVIADTRNQRLRRIATDGTISTIAGDGIEGVTGDGGPAIAARVSSPTSLVRDASGVITFVDGAVRLRRISAAGVISTLATTNNTFTALALSASGTLYAATQSTVSRVETNGTLTVVAGNGSGGDGGLATSAEFLDIRGIAVAPDGTLRIADDCRVRRVVVGGIVTTIAGAASECGFSGDDGPATAARFQLITSVAFLPNGNLLVGDGFNACLRQVTSAGVVSTFAGGGSLFDLEDGTALAGNILGFSRAAATSSGGAIVAFADLDIVRRFTSSGVATSVAGAIDPLGSGPFATSAAHGVLALAKRTTTAAFAAAGGRVLRIDSGTGKVDVVAGYRNSFTAEPSARFSTEMYGASGVAIVGGDLVVGASFEHRLIDLNAGAPTTWPISTSRYLISPEATRALASSGSTLWWTTPSCVLSSPVAGGSVTTVAGSCATPGFANGTVTAARFDQPEGIAVLADGTVYVSDTRNHRVRRIRAGIVSTIAGTGIDNNTGADGSTAVVASISSPRQIAVDSAGHLYIAAGDAVRMIADDDGDGIVDGGDRIYTIYDGGRCLRALALMDNDRLWVADACDGSIVELER